MNPNSSRRRRSIRDEVVRVGFPVVISCTVTLLVVSVVWLGADRRPKEQRIPGPVPTAIALETSKGNLALALGLGVILIALALAVNLAALGLRDVARAQHA